MVKGGKTDCLLFLGLGGGGGGGGGFFYEENVIFFPSEDYPSENSLSIFKFSTMHSGERVFNLTGTISQDTDA
jgi:hypothetical protein